MKKLLTLVLCWLIAFSAMATTTFKAKTALSAAGGYITSLNKVDGSFEDGTAGWVASTDTIVQTASTEFQGNYKGTWTATGTGTLDLQWTATASNTYEASAQVNVQGEDDMYVCAYVGTTETGCKLIPALNKIQKVSVVADSVLSSAFYLRLKHTGSDAFSIDVDDGKIEPWTQQIANLSESIYATYTTLSSTTITSGTALKFNTKISDSHSAYNSSTGIFTAPKTAHYTISVASGGLTYASSGGDPRIAAYINGVSSGVTFLVSSGAAAYQTISGTISLDLLAGQQLTLIPNASSVTNSTDLTLSITAAAISENVVQSWQPSDSLGELRFLPQNVAPKGFIPALGSSIGKTAGTYQGDAYYDLYKVLWTQSSVTAGEPYVISSAKGTDAATDWAANKTITIDVSGLFVRAYKSGTTGTVGAKQDDAFQSHRHQQKIATGGSGSITRYNAAQLTDLLNTANTGAYTDIPSDDGIGGVSRTAAETRPTNIAQYAFIRYGNDAPALLALPASKENRFEVTFNSDATIANKNTSLITATKTGMGLYTINYSGLGLTQAPIVKLEELSGFNLYPASNPRFRDILTVTATQTTIKTGYNSGSAPTASDMPFVVTLVKANSDYTAPGVFVGNVAKNQVATLYANPATVASINGGVDLTFTGVNGDASIVAHTGGQANFTLQAGEYLIESEGLSKNTGNAYHVLYNVSLGANVESSMFNYNLTGSVIRVGGKFSRVIVTSATTFKIIQYGSNADSSGWGDSSWSGSRAKLQITKLNGN